MLRGGRKTLVLCLGRGGKEVLSETGRKKDEHLEPLQAFYKVSVGIFLNLKIIISNRNNTLLCTFVLQRMSTFIS